MEYVFGEETNKKIKHELRLFLSDDKRVCRKCEEDRFHIYIRYGSGGSGVYFVFVCIKCGTTITIDIDNPNYEG